MGGDEQGDTGTSWRRKYCWILYFLDIDGMSTSGWVGGDEQEETGTTWRRKCYCYHHFFVEKIIMS